MSKIQNITAREILSSSAYPTIEVVVTLANGISQKASVPYGESAGSHEAHVLVDGKRKYFLGKGCQKAIYNVEKKIAPKLKGIDAVKQEKIDQIMIQLDGTKNKSRLGGNAILGVSLAVSRAGAQNAQTALYAYIRKIYSLKKEKYILPKPMMVVIEGGVHASDSTDFQEYMIVPDRFSNISESIRAGAEVYLFLKKVLQAQRLNTNVGNEGAYAPEGIKNNEKPFELIVQAIKTAGYKPGKQVSIALDAAATEIYKKGRYVLTKEKKSLTSSEMIDYYSQWVKKYPIISIEDPLAEDDWEGFQEITQKLGGKIKIIGDDLTVTNVERLQKAINLNAMNAILIKPNQIGTLTETVNTMKLAHDNNYWTVVSHRGGGETNDTYIIDLAVALNSRFVKVGISRGERVAKYNRLMEIEQDLKL